ncbi:MAG: DUF4401 domain-containing protein [Planctomycetota bacterium]|nr:DUF4401 domain-containing protein [Planctomycetota bacterium]MDA1251204.1 DUF4401 domain-containing protein [Planctomycetota bacterium]
MSTPEIQPVAQDSLTIGDLLTKLGAGGFLDLSQPGNSLAVLNDEVDSTPHVVQMLVGAGAWIACCCIVLGLAIVGILEEGASAVVCGVAMSAAAVFLHRVRTGLFAEHFSLAAALTGVVMFTVGFQSGHQFLLMALASVVAAAVMYVPFASATFRFLTAAFAISMLSVALADDVNLESLHVLILLETVGAGFIFTRLPQSMFRPLGYALAAAMLGTLLVTFFDEMSVWPAALVQVCAQLWLLNFALSTGQKRVPLMLGLSAAAAGLLGLLSAPGILAAIGVIVLGHLERDILLRSLGVLFLPVYLVAFYYNLETSLLTKSGILIASGAVLWGARWYLRERIAAGLFDGGDLPETIETGDAS